MKTYDVVIVGGGPAGLSAALTLGRGRASALLVDGGTPRNARARAIHNFVTRDGTPPAEFRALARAQLAAYASVEACEGIVARVEQLAAVDEAGLAFVLTFSDAHDPVGARRVLLATGMRDELPPIPGLAELWGASVFQCPYCHGWELRDRPWGVLTNTESMVAFAPILSAWSSHVTAFTNGAHLPDGALDRLRQSGFTIELEPIARLRGGGAIDGVELASGRTVACDALVLRPPQSPVELVLSLGLARDELGYVRVDEHTKESSVPGVHVVGDTVTMQQSAIIAAAQGMVAAAMINHALILERLARAAARG